jgi:putative FmdB family regulatory protein
MPTYEYECTKCGHRFDVFQSIRDEPVKRCPQCRRKVRRLLGAGAGILFKGSGFYITDYRSKGYQEAAKSEQKAPAPAESKKATPAADSGGGGSRSRPPASSAKKAE